MFDWGGRIIINTSMMQKIKSMDWDMWVHVVMQVGWQISDKRLIMT